MKMTPTLELFQPIIGRLKNGERLTAADRESCVLALEIAAGVKDLDMVALAAIGTLATQVFSKE